MATYSSVPAWRIPGRWSLVGCCLWGRTELDMAEATQQQQQCLLKATWAQFENDETSALIVKICAQVFVTLPQLSKTWQDSCEYNT